MIKRIKIRDFKSIRDVDLELDPVTVLVGRSGTGKSNLVQAMRFLRNLLLDFNQAVAFEGGWPRIVPAGVDKPGTSIEAWFSLPGDNREHAYRLGFSMADNQAFSPGREPVLINESLAVGGEQVFARSVRAGGPWAWDHAPRLATVPHQLGGPMLGAFPSLQEVVHAHAALSTGVGYYHLPSSALDPVRNQGIGPQLQQHSQGLWDNAANYREVMRGIAQDFHHPSLRKNLLATLQRVNPSIASIELDSVISPQRAVVGHLSGGIILELNLEQESDGLRRFYAHLLALYQHPAKLVLIFEEPENAIFPGALSLLADEFKAAPRENRGQVILTTHSPGLLDSFDVDSVRVVEMRDGATVVGRVSKEQRQNVRDHLLSTGDLLTVDDARLDQENHAPQPA